MPTPTIPAGNLFMNATTYTGNGGTLTVTNGVAGQSFQPDLVWTKSRSSASTHLLFDSIRGVYNYLISATTDAEGSLNTTLTSFNSNGFSVGSNSTINNNTSTNVAWQWKAGGAAVSNTQGTITSSVSANQTSGFSVVTYTGNGSAGATVGHGLSVLGVAPSFITIKNRGAVGSWHSYHSALGGTQGILVNAANAASTDSGFWNNTNPSSSVITLGTYNTFSSQTYVAYCWAPIAGYSAFGSYTGNGSTDGPFVYTGFRPRFVIFKSSSFADQWHMLDTSRSTYNSVSSAMLYANLSAAEADYSAYPIDFLSNGFKFRTSAAFANQSGDTYIYMAFAENPFKYANAR
jgi:hypothetical protein